LPRSFAFTVQSAKKSDRLKLTLYFDPIRRSLELMNLDIVLSFQQVLLEEFLLNKGIFTDVATITRDYCYYDFYYSHWFFTPHLSLLYSFFPLYRSPVI